MYVNQALFFSGMLSILLCICVDAKGHLPGSDEDCMELEYQCAQLMETEDFSIVSTGTASADASFEPEEMKQPDYIRACRLEERILPCVRNWASRCLKAGQADFFLETTSQMLQRCYDMDSYLNYVQMFKCDLKMSNDTEIILHENQCREKLTTLEQSYSGPMITWGWPVLSQAVRSETYREDICCMVNKSLKCGLEDVEKICGSDQLKSFHDEAEQTFDIFHCTHEIRNKCQ